MTLLLPVAAAVSPRPDAEAAGATGAAAARLAAAVKRAAVAAAALGFGSCVLMP